jgi:hypothetical protein
MAPRSVAIKRALEPEIKAAAKEMARRPCGHVLVVSSRVPTPAQIQILRGLSL